MNVSGYMGRRDLQHEVAGAGRQRSGNAVAAVLGKVQHIAGLTEVLVRGKGMLGRVCQARELHAGEQQQQRRQDTTSPGGCKMTAQVRHGQRA